MTPGVPWDADVAGARLTAVADTGSILLALQSLQEWFGYVHPDAVPLVADALQASRADVYGVLTFYRDLRTAPATGPVVRVCMGEACQAVGARALRAEVEALDLVEAGGVEVDTVYCLGNCALGPSACVDGRLVGRATAADVTSAVRAALATRPVERGGHARLAEGERATSTLDGALLTVYVPRDSAARAVGADQVAEALAEAFAGTPAPQTPGTETAGTEAADARIVRTGSRGLLWLEPLVEADLPSGRMAFGPVTVADVETLAAALAGDGSHPLALGPAADLPWLRDQERLTFARLGVADPLDADAYVAHGGLRGLGAALAMGPAAGIEAVADSGLRGRGGAGFPAGIKWRTVASQDAPACVVVNADEGDSGTFADRMLMEGDPFTILEGMAIAGLCVGAEAGYLYIRSEYPDAIASMRAAIDAARQLGWVGDDVLGGGHRFEIEVRVGAGSYVCGEETAMLESLEGRRGMVRAKPPLPAVAGLHGRPTLIHNVLTIAAVPGILADGPQAYARLGSGRSLGTQVFQLGGNIARGGIVEAPFGITLRELVEGYGGGTRSGRPVRAVQVGGPLGAYLRADQLDVPMDYESLAAAGGMLGHGGIVVFDDTVDMAEQARFAMAFCAEESCGKCTPCRIGSVRGVEVIDRIRTGSDRTADIALLEDLCEVMADGSLCAMGGLTPMPVLSALHGFPEDFGGQR